VIRTRWTTTIQLYAVSPPIASRQASFHWEASGQALYRARRAAQGHGVGLFEASGDDAAVWMMSQRGRFEVVHRADDEHRRFG
jgi:hypothetical protein